MHQSVKVTVSLPRPHRLQLVTSWFCDCWTVVVSVPLDELEQARDRAAATVHADVRIRGAASDSATLPEVRFVFELDADFEDQAIARAASVIGVAAAGGHLAQAQWTYRARPIG